MSCLQQIFHTPILRVRYGWKSMGVCGGQNQAFWTPFILESAAYLIITMWSVLFLIYQNRVRKNIICKHLIFGCQRTCMIVPGKRCVLDFTRLTLFLSFKGKHDFVNTSSFIFEMHFICCSHKCLAFVLMLIPQNPQKKGNPPVEWKKDFYLLSAKKTFKKKIDLSQSLNK